MCNKIPHAPTHKTTGEHSAVPFDVFIVGHEVVYRWIETTEIRRKVAVYIIVELENIDYPAFFCCNPWYMVHWGVEVFVCDP